MSATTVAFVGLAICWAVTFVSLVMMIRTLDELVVFLRELSKRSPRTQVTEDFKRRMTPSNREDSAPDWMPGDWKDPTS